MRVDHDISLLIPEIWARLDPGQRHPAFLIKRGYLEPLEDFEHGGKPVLASRLGYRITEQFVHAFFGKIFDKPQAVFTAELLKPEIQDLDAFVDGVNNIVEAQQRVAQRYLDDGSIQTACPPLRALLHIMASGHYRGRDTHHPKIRVMFTREHMLKSDWYRQRLKVKQQRDIERWQRNTRYLENFLADTHFDDEAARLDIAGRLARAGEMLKRVQSRSYAKTLVGTLGADPLTAPGRLAEQRSFTLDRVVLPFRKDPQHDDSLTLLQRFKARFRRTGIEGGG
jgi:hypothetical protein